jgi:hypothetical protein
MESAPEAKQAYPHIHQSPLVGEENQTLECNTTCHAKPDVVCIYEYTVCLNPSLTICNRFYLLLTNWDEQFVHNY